MKPARVDLRGGGGDHIYIYIPLSLSLFFQVCVAFGPKTVHQPISRSADEPISQSTLNPRPLLTQKTLNP